MTVFFPMAPPIAGPPNVSGVIRPPPDPLPPPPPGIPLDEAPREWPPDDEDVRTLMTKAEASERPGVAPPIKTETATSTVKRFTTATPLTSSRFSRLGVTFRATTMPRAQKPFKSILISPQSGICLWDFDRTVRRRRAARQRL